jgi:hypothetical protein
MEYEKGGYLVVQSQGEGRGRRGEPSREHFAGHVALISAGSFPLPEAKAG